MLSSFNQPGKPYFTREEVLDMIRKLPNTRFTFGNNGWTSTGISSYYSVNPEQILQELERKLPLS